jgi:hypothetical protein
VGQTQDPYTYTDGNPVNLTDPTGLHPAYDGDSNLQLRADMQAYGAIVVAQATGWHSVATRRALTRAATAAAAVTPADAAASAAAGAAEQAAIIASEQAAAALAAKNAAAQATFEANLQNAKNQSLAHIFTATVNALTGNLFGSMNDLSGLTSGLGVFGNAQTGGVRSSAAQTLNLGAGMTAKIDAQDPDCGSPLSWIDCSKKWVTDHLNPSNWSVGGCAALCYQYNIGDGTHQWGIGVAASLGVTGGGAPLPNGGLCIGIKRRRRLQS